MSFCPFCGKENERPSTYCPHCGQAMEQPSESSVDADSMTPPVPPAPGPDVYANGTETTKARMTVPFEDPSHGFFDGLFQTVKLTLFRPTYFFSSYQFDGSIGKPLVFALIVGWVAAAVGLLWGLLFNASIMTALGQYVPKGQYPLNKMIPQYMLGTVTSMLSLIIAPVAIILGVFILAGIYHLFLLMVNGASRGFETTINVVCYRTAAKLVLIIPLCGGTVAWIYSLVIAIIGLSEAHETDGWKAAFAVLVPLALCCCAIFASIGMFGLTIAGLASHR